METTYRSTGYSDEKTWENGVGEAKFFGSEIAETIPNLGQHGMLEQQ